MRVAARVAAEGATPDSLNDEGDEAFLTTRWRAQGPGSHRATAAANGGRLEVLSPWTAPRAIGRRDPRPWSAGPDWVPDTAAQYPETAVAVLRAAPVVCAAVAWARAVAE